jgi:hypothetical protein
MVAVLSTLSATAIIAAVSMSTRISILEEKEKTTLQYFASIDTKMSFVLCKMGEESECE